MEYIKNRICSDLEGKINSLSTKNIELEDKINSLSNKNIELEDKINSLCLIINSTFNRENCARDIWSLWTTDTIDTKEL